MVGQLKHMPLNSALDQLKVALGVARSFSMEARGLFYDELAATCENLHPELSQELSNIILKEFEEAYVVNLEDADSQGRILYEITRSDSPLAVPFAGIRADSRMLTMFPKLRLILRMLAVNDNLDEISALHACAVVLPDCDVADFVVLNPSKRKEVVDSYFRCINYFRELVNGFSRDKSSMKTVVTRVEQIVEMVKLLSKFLSIVRNYTPPACQFFEAAKAPVIKRPKAKGKGKGKSKKGKGARNKNYSDDSDDDCSKTKTKNKVDDDNSDDDFVSETVALADMSLYRNFFRELDMNVFIILQWPICPENEKTENVTLSREAVKFLLTEYVFKLESIFTVRAASPFHKADAPATLVETTLAAKYCTKLVPLLRIQLDTVINSTKDRLADCGGVYDAHDMFKAGAAEEKECATLLLRCMCVILAWPGLKYLQNTELKDTILARLTRQRVIEGSDINYAREAFDAFVAMANNIVHLPGAVALLKLLKEISAFNPTERYRKTINQVSKKFLQRTWFDLDGNEEKLTPQFNANIDTLLVFYAESLPTENRLKHVTALIKNVETEQEEMETSDCLPSFPNILKQNFHLMYKVLCESLADVLKLAKKTSDWSKIADALASLTAIIQHLQNFKNLKHYTKLCNDFLTALLKKGKGMDILQKSPTEAVTVLKTIQVTTRYVHRVINDAKAKKDLRLSALIPMVRKNNEKLIIRVKSMCAACPEAFSTGNLRNKNLAGEEIFSQQMEDFDTPLLEQPDSDIDDNLEENSDDATDSDISSNI